MSAKQQSSFGPFLDALERGTRPREEGGGASMEILRILQKNDDHRMPVKDLMEASGVGTKMRIEVFGSALANVKEAGFVVLRMASEGEIAELTEIGQKVAGLGKA